MRKLLAPLVFCAAALLLAACSTLPVPSARDDHIRVTILHFNDIYEITPTGGGKEGGIARVATLRRQLLARNPNTITTLGGDLFNPSAIGTAVYQGDRLAGRQMVDVLNHFGLDYATFGNHEFDLKESQFRQRMSESTFGWVSSNVLAADGRPYPGVREHVVIPFTDARTGRAFRVGMFGVTKPVNQPDHVRYTSAVERARQQVAELDSQADFIVALTHQDLDEDAALVEALPRVGLVLGGHEHVNFQHWRGHFTPILKADANVRSVYVVDLDFDPRTGTTKVSPALVPIDERLQPDRELQAVVDQWVAIAFDAFRKQGFRPQEAVTTTHEALDGLESSVRTRRTNLGQLIARSMLRPYPDAELALYNSGSIRIDDVLPPGVITEYDVIRILPFGGKVQLAAIRGSLLARVLDHGLANAGAGSFLQSANVERVDGKWQVNDRPIEPGRTYRLAINDFLASGKEQGMDYLKPDGRDFLLLDAGDQTDTRQLLIDALRTH